MDPRFREDDWWIPAFAGMTGGGGFDMHVPKPVTLQTIRAALDNWVPDATARQAPP